jgi:hypothetical protein
LLAIGQQKIHEIGEHVSHTMERTALTRRELLSHENAAREMSESHENAGDGSKCTRVIPAAKTSSAVG